MKLGCACHSDSLRTRREELLRLPVLELENYLFPGFADLAHEQLAAIRDLLAGYRGELVLAGPYVDLNPGSPERLVREAVHVRYAQARDLAIELGALQVVFLSTFLPFVRLPSYEDDWVSRSIAFWRVYMLSVPPALTIALANTFESHPDYLLRIVEAIGRPNLRLALDVGHYLVYGEIELGEWLQRIAPHCSTVYVHSNDGRADTHDAPYTGALGSESMRQIVQALPADTRYILKMNDKDTLEASLEWVERAARRETA